jgi:hypothetical protein
MHTGKPAVVEVLGELLQQSLQQHGQAKVAITTHGVNQL